MWNWLQSRFQAKPTCLYVEGYSTCSYFKQAKCIALAIQEKNPQVTINIREVPRENWQTLLQSTKQSLGVSASEHRTSPIVYQGCGDEKHFIGNITLDLIC